ncbi:MAG TPA: complex I NDUFA9 subunit family protein [Gemmatimonadaceae bacterium]|nr:complex I NDUFA9 subunit family protein [Gemmatimonadaceae bacterium]
MKSDGPPTPDLGHRHAPTAVMAEGGAAQPEPDPAPTPLPRSAPVLVTGASGLVGTHACRELASHGWTIRALVRNSEKAAGRLAELPVEIIVGEIRDESTVRRAAAGAAAVIHLAAIAIEHPGERYEDVNTEATRIVLHAVRAAGVTRFVQMSQNGASSRSPSRFLRSKGVAEEMVRASGLDWTVLRPSVIVGPEDAFVNVLARLIRLTPLVLPLPAGGTARFQPIAVGDVARVAARVLDRSDTVGGVYSLGGPAILTLRQMAERILIAMRERRVIVGVPVGIMRPLIALAAHLLPHPPVTPSLLELLDVDNTVSGHDLTEVFGITPMPFAPEELGYLRAITRRDALASLFTG